MFLHFIFTFTTPLVMLIQLPALLEYFSLSFKCPTIHTPQNAVHFYTATKCCFAAFAFVSPNAFNLPIQP